MVLLEYSIYGNKRKGNTSISLTLSLHNWKVLTNLTLECVETNWTVGYGFLFSESTHLFETFRKSKFCQVVWWHWPFKKSNLFSEQILYPTKDWNEFHDYLTGRTQKPTTWSIYLQVSGEWHTLSDKKRVAPQKYNYEEILRKKSHTRPIFIFLCSYVITKFFVG